jgi:hypothetical protein
MSGLALKADILGNSIEFGLLVPEAGIVVHHKLLRSWV